MQLHEILGFGHKVDPSEVLHEGPLFRLGVLKDWIKRHVELTTDCLNIYSSKGVRVFTTFSALPD